MRSLSIRGPWLVLVLAFLSLGAGRTQLRGPASGLWDLETGAVLGTLDSFAGRTLYALEASLAPYPLLCPACLGGAISGTLDDGRGAGPDFLVAGGYQGVTFGGGSGSFTLSVRTPGGRTVGELAGRFEHGAFVARYSIRR